MSGAERQRLDRWLFFARIVKSRTLGARLVESGAVRVNREKVSHAAAQVKSGDVLTIQVAGRVVVLRIRAPGTRRGPAPEARLLYEDLGMAKDPEKPDEPPS